MLSIQDLINKSIEDKQKEITINIKEMDGDIKVRIPTLKEMDELRGKHGKCVDNLAKDLVYNCCVEPRLNDNVLIEHYKCDVVPFEVVEKVFGYNVTIGIADIILEELDVSGAVTKKIETVKN